jgi:uncharacterized delta-60 repeat protein
MANCFRFVNNNISGATNFISGTTCFGGVGAFNVNYGESICIDVDNPFISCGNLFWSGDCNCCFGGVGTNDFGIVNAILQDRLDPQKVMVVGGFTTYNGQTKRTMVRSEINGLIDTTFDAGTGFAPSTVIFGVKEVSQQTDGKYICVGDFTTFRGVSRRNIARVNYDGTLDTSFVVGTGYTYQTFYSLIQSSGKILVCSIGANQYNGTNIGALSRLNTDGSLDTTFNNIDILGTSGTLLSKIHENADGTFYVCGNVVKSGRRGILKLNANGTYASTDPFNTSGVGLAGGSIADFQVQADGKLICVGDFSNYNGAAVPRSIMRLNANGTRDNTFNPTNSGANNNIFEVELQGSKYVVCSFAATYSGIPTNQVFRINADGSYDSSFNDGNFVYTLGPEDSIQHTTILTGNTSCNGDIFVGGLFTAYDGILTNNILLMDGDGFMQDCTEIKITPTPTPSMTATMTMTPTKTPTNTPTITSTPTMTPSNTATLTPTATTTIGLTPTATETPSQTPTITQTPSSTLELTPTPSATSSQCPEQVYRSAGVFTCSDLCTINYNIGSPQISSQPYASLTIGDFLCGLSAGYYAISDVSTDTATGPFTIADVDGTGEILGLYVCSGGSCIPL